ncbi:hypothetical protein HPP92_024376 [Vanilla planifolia]|uniref:Uncharacterized protein n=1 Tax=Vanilla planifolia TaxID=51239 RepID=A0A835PSP1_VANPL|nr:hypothetical protein HPP92_024376 [Vanilla planifolia]
MLLAWAIRQMSICPSPASPMGSISLNPDAEQTQNSNLLAMSRRESRARGDREPRGGGAREEEEEEKLPLCSQTSCKTCAAGMAADCVALCCCPCAAVSCLVLAFLRVPWAVGRRCVRRVGGKVERARVGGDDLEKVEGTEKKEAELTDLVEEVADGDGWGLEEKSFRLEFCRIKQWGFGRLSFSSFESDKEIVARMEQ